MLQGAHGVDLEINQSLHERESIAKEEPGPIECPEEVADHRERRPFDTFEEESRASCGIHPSLNGRCLQVRVDFVPNPEQLSGSFEISETLLQVAIAHVLVVVSVRAKLGL